MLQVRFAALLIASVPMASPSSAQPGGYTTADKKAIRQYESGLQAMRQGNGVVARRELLAAAKADPRFIEPRILLGELSEQEGRDQEAIAHYREVVAISPRFFPAAQLRLADLELRTGRYTEAERNYRAFLAQEQEPQRRARAKLGIDNCLFAQQAVQHPVPFEPVNLGPGVNSADPEYYPAITADGRTLLFTRHLDRENPLTRGQEDFFISQLGEDGAWGPARPLPGVNSDRNEGAPTLSPDGRFLIFTACEQADGGYGEGRKGLGSCDLFISMRAGGRWSPPENLGPPVNSRHWETQPSLASDGRTLYFVRGLVGADRRIGEMDIYTTVMQDDGTWSKPEKLGPNVNTPFQEESVSIHPDGTTLYFSSDGHPGMGGLDLYVSRRQPDGGWGPAQNLGHPINTGGNENSLLVDARGELAYFASDRPGGHGELDLYAFKLHEAARPVPVSYIRGRVYDEVTRRPLEADVELHDLSTGMLATAAYSDPVNGEFLVCLPDGRSYGLHAAAKGYLFFSRNYAPAVGTWAEPVTLDVPLTPIRSGSTIALRNIFFDTGSHALLPTSQAELDKLFGLLRSDPSLRIEIGGHTDAVGKETDNLALSERRAQAVRDHLTGRGIDGGRIVARGYGEARPVAPNDTEEGRALNRRTEVKVL